MHTRFVMTMTLALACAFASGNSAIAASGPNVPAKTDANTASQSDTHFIWLTYAATGNNPLSSKEPGSDLFELVQVQFALYCYTYAGPVCPMRVAVPVGSPCTCYYPDGALAGIAR
jgi:hypothetical protein